MTPMAATKGVGKLREVVDYWACDECLEHPSREQEYFCAVCRRLQRDAAVEPRPVASPRVRGTRSDAVRVIPPDEWEAANRARERVLENELELARLQQREGELQGQIEGLQKELDELRDQETSPIDSRRRVRFDLVGVRRPEEQVEFQEEFEELPPEEPLPMETGAYPEPAELPPEPEGGPGEPEPAPRKRSRRKR